ncbi:MAG: CAP domain-containing protein [Vicinamibacteraceae bacterium]|nr:CAP domain-containing protein [Vicinamibacteraceae bacterium]
MPHRRPTAWLAFVLAAIAAGTAAQTPPRMPLPGGVVSTGRLAEPAARPQAGTADAADAPPPLSWLELVNLYRASAGLPPVADNPTYAGGCELHARYCVKNDILVHPEDAANAWYTPEGDEAGRSSNLAATSNVNASDRFAVDAWMQAPFHGLGVLDPRLEWVAYGAYREADGGLQMVAALDVVRGINWGRAATYPVAWPGHGSSIPLSVEQNCPIGTVCYWGEYPDAVASCPGYAAPAGLPIVLQLGRGNLTPGVTASAFRANGVAMEHCVYSETTYTNPDAAAQNLGRQILDQRDAVVLIPRQPLTTGTTYAVAVTVDGQSYAWEFTVGEFRPAVGPPVPPPSPPPGDADSDGLPDAWEADFGLNPNSSASPDGAADDPDGDGVTNADEYARGTHPRGFHKRFLAEGATSTLFDVRLTLFNPQPQAATAVVQYLRMEGDPIVERRVLAGYGRLAIDPKGTTGMSRADFSTLVESDVPLVVDRTMTWDAATGYGSHAETAVEAPALDWYMAEGATHSGFALYYLLQNPNDTQVDVDVEYLLPGGPLPPRRYTLAPRSRTNIHVNAQAGLASTDVSAVVRSVAGGPIVVERAMYLSRTRLFEAGHASAAVRAPSPQWFFAEGATGPYFDLYLLLANPGATPVNVEVRYLLPSGHVVNRLYAVAAKSRRTVHVDGEHEWLASTPVSMEVRSLEGLPVIAERSMWWPGSWRSWQEGHNAFGALSAGDAWALADGAVGGSRAESTYVLIANTAAAPGSARVRLYFDDGTMREKVMTLLPSSRTTVGLTPSEAPRDPDFGPAFPPDQVAAGRRFSVVVESLGTTPVPIVVERAMYSSDGRTPAFSPYWPAGTGAVATRLRR